ncbi:MAG: co-chaperone YbbN [Devosiaceae bacterium]|nr:co-chaperone YbbN [Devosiaceae bacterium MH13]
MLIGTGGAPQAGEASAGDVIDVTTATFMADVIEESKTRPVIVDFWAPWCGPCRQLTPALEAVTAKAGGQIRLAKMNIDDHPEVAGQMGVQSIPAVFAFVDGRPADGFMGAQSEAQVQAFVDKLIGPQGPSQTEQIMEGAQLSLDKGDLSTAAKMFSAVLQAEPDNAAAMAGMLKVYVAASDVETARQAADSLTDELKADPAIAAAITAIELAEKAAALGDPAALRAKLDANPDDHQARFDLALIHNAMNQREQAAQALVEIVKRDRSWNDDGARKELLNLFDAWGAGDPASIAGRKQLSRVLFS